MRLALYQPDIPQNAGTLLRLAACLEVAVDIVEPCGFAFTDKLFLRAGLDYLPHANYLRHVSWEAYLAARPPGGRLVLLSTGAATRHFDFAYRADDTLLVGRETAGVPDSVRRATDAQIRIPMRAGLRSLNVAVAAAIALGEALRQTGGFPAEHGDGSR